MTDPNTATPSIEAPVIEPVAHDDSPVASLVFDITAVIARVRQWRANVANGDLRDSVRALEDIETLLGATPAAPADDTVSLR